MIFKRFALKHLAVVGAYAMKDAWQKDAWDASSLDDSNNKGYITNGKGQNLRGGEGHYNKDGEWVRNIGRPRLQIDPLKLLTGLAGNIFNPPQGNGGWGADGERAAKAAEKKPDAKMFHEITNALKDATAKPEEKQTDPFTALLNTFLGGPPVGEVLGKQAESAAAADDTNTKVEWIDGKEVIIQSKPHEDHGSHHLEIQPPSAQGIVEALDIDFDKQSNVIQEGMKTVSNSIGAIADNFVKDVLGGKGNEISTLMNNIHVDEKLSKNVQKGLADMSNTVHQYKPVLQRGARVVDHVNDLAEKFAEGVEKGDDMSGMIAEGFKLFNHISEEVAGATHELGFDQPPPGTPGAPGQLPSPNGNGAWDPSALGNGGWTADTPWGNANSAKYAWNDASWNAHTNWWDPAPNAKTSTTETSSKEANGELVVSTLETRQKPQTDQVRQQEEDDEGIHNQAEI